MKRDLEIGQKLKSNSGGGGCRKGILVEKRTVSVLKV